MAIPIVVVAYNRLACLERILNSVNRAVYEKDDVELIISIDRGDNADVLEFANNFEWLHGTKRVIYQAEKLGLRKHILRCGDLTSQYDAIILLEDDLFVSKQFYSYACQAFAFVGQDDRIGGVSLYNHRFNVDALMPFYPIDDGFDNWYFQYAASWGQMWTKNQWAAFKAWYQANTDFDFQNDSRIPADIKEWGDNSWLKYYIAYLIDTERYFLYPRVSLSTNSSEPGIHHTERHTDFQVPLLTGHHSWRFSSLEQSDAVYDAFYENERLRCTDGQFELVVDLYGRKPVPAKECYFLTSSKIPGGTVIRSYGREIRPHDLNIAESQEGTDFVLYKLSGNEKKAAPRIADRMKPLRYYYVGLVFKNLVPAVLLFSAELPKKIANRLSRLFRRP